LRFVISLTVLASGLLMADPVLTFNTSSAFSAANFNQTVGWEFDVTSPITVTGLGWYDQGGNGLSTAHEVGIWDLSGDLVASVLVGAGTTDPLDGLFRTASVTPIVLSAGDYIVGGQNFSTNTEQLAFGVAPTITDPSVSFLGGEYSSGTGFSDPTNHTGVADCCWGPSFSVAATPEPADASAFLALGVLAAALFARRRHRLSQSRA